CGVVDAGPELADRRMGGAPVGLKPLDFSVGKLVRLKFTPGIEPAHVAKCQIAGFTDAPLRALFREGAVCDAIYFACSNAIRLIARILGGVITSVAVQFPFFAGNPG